MDITVVSKAAKMMREANDLLSKGPLDFYLVELAASYELLMERFAPFKVGDRVCLAKTPDINKTDSWGWMSSKHFLLEGAVGTVAASQCGSKGFAFSIEFDDESWIDVDGNKHTATEKHGYLFREDMLAHIPKSSDQIPKSRTGCNPKTATR